MNQDAPLYELYAIRYARRDARHQEHFYEHDACGDDDMPMDYFTWLAVCGETVIGIDAGFKQAVGERRGREYIAPPMDTMRRLGIEPAQVQQLILTHLHYDHCGNVDAFPRARVVLQEQEMAFWTGRWAGRGQFAHLTEPEDLSHLIHLNAEGRIRWVEGDLEIAPGVSVHHVGGHTPGMQIVRLNTRRGAVVIASDASHYYGNIEADRPFRTLHTVPLMYAAFDRIKELASGPECIVAGHDPEVLRRFPAARPELAGLVVKLA
ncbi:MAG TPA: N-acyl homoserine lactonase family protein [Chloroflexota bacterium]|nr:N-acyl homoserine lactonase family protein [Chloroflexota bacterium]